MACFSAVYLESTQRLAINILSLGSVAIPLLQSGLTNHVTVIHRGDLHEALGSPTGMAWTNDATLVEARVSLNEGGDSVRIVNLTSSPGDTLTKRYVSNVSLCSDDTKMLGLASISALIPLERLHGSMQHSRSNHASPEAAMEQLERELYLWNSMHSFAQGLERMQPVSNEYDCRSQIQMHYSLLERHHGSLSSSLSRSPEEMYCYLKDRIRESNTISCGYGISDTSFKNDESPGSGWGALACIVATSQLCDDSNNAQVQTVSLFNSTRTHVHDNIVSILGKCAWAKKCGFLFRSSSGSFPISITRKATTSAGMACIAQISRIVIYTFPTCEYNKNAAKSRAKGSMSDLLRSAVNNAIQQLKINMDARQDEWADASRPDADAINTLIESLTGVLHRAHDTSDAAKSFLLAIAQLGPNTTMQDVQTQLRDKVMTLQKCGDRGA